MSKGGHWRKNQRKDRFFQQAKADGYRARSVYKLEGIQQRFRLLSQGQRVLDIGAAPGSWSQYAQAQVGASGLVVAVDLTPIEPLAGVRTIEGDIRDREVQARLSELTEGQRFDLVLSDIAPKTTGIQLTDHARSMELALFALAVALEQLRPGGHFVTKVFEGEDLTKLIELMARYFKRVFRFDPEATRRESKETFVVAKSLKATTSIDASRGVEWLWLQSEESIPDAS